MQAVHAGVVVVAITLAGGATFAQDAPKKSVPVSHFLAPGDLDPALILPPPPNDDAAAALEGREELHRLAAARTPARLAQAKQDDTVEDVRAFANVMGPDFDIAKLTATARLFAGVRSESSIAGKRAKAYFQRERPFLNDPGLNVCDDGHDRKNSYPSGHATMGYTTAAILAQLAPARAQAVLARASDYAESRLFCGVHYRMDIQASQVLGNVLAQKLMANPEFKAEMEAARAELVAAHIAP